MSLWGKPDNRYYEHGVDRGMLKVNGAGPTVPWDGLVSVEERQDSKDPEVVHLDGVKIYNRRKPSDFAATIEAYYSPPEFDACDGTLAVEESDKIYSSNNSPVPFDFSYRTMINDTDYKLHFVYNALAEPTVRNVETITDTKNPNTLSWDITTTPNSRSGGKRTHFILDTTKSGYGVVRYVERSLYGEVSGRPEFPTFSKIVSLVNLVSQVSIEDHGDGLWTIDAPDSVAKMINTTERLFEIDWYGIDIVDDNSFDIRE